MRRNIFNLSRFSSNSRSLCCNSNRNHITERNSTSLGIVHRRFSSIFGNDPDCTIQWKSLRTYTERKSTNCWNCHRPIDVLKPGTKESFFCSNCGSLQKISGNYVSWSIWLQTVDLFLKIISTQNYFVLFGIAQQFQVNQNELTKNFRDFQSVLHPDKFSRKWVVKESIVEFTLTNVLFRSEIEQNASAEISSLVNKAYKILSVPIKRAEYILELNGITIPEDNSAVDKEFLFEIMERNEEVQWHWHIVRVGLLISKTS